MNEQSNQDDDAAINFLLALIDSGAKLQFAEHWISRLRYSEGMAITKDKIFSLYMMAYYEGAVAMLELLNPGAAKTKIDG